LKDKQSIDAEVLDYYEKELSDAVFSGLKIIRADSGFVEVNVKIKDEGNVDARGKVKTKVLTTLCDIASRLAGASAGVRAETISITVNIQGNEATGGNAIALAEVKHRGRTTVVAAAEIKTSAGRILATSLSTMRVEGFFDEITEK
jgi:uncharacterized protein (TIGR00369 family)